MLIVCIGVCAYLLLNSNKSLVLQTDLPTHFSHPTYNNHVHPKALFLRIYQNPAGINKACGMRSPTSDWLLSLYSAQL